MCRRSGLHLAKTSKHKIHDLQAFLTSNSSEGKILFKAGDPFTFYDLKKHTTQPTILRFLPLNRTSKKIILLHQNPRSEIYKLTII
jgi:UDP-2,3-diacylglucosamine pyrophosphatase LpxH